MSGPHPSGNAPLRGQMEWGQGERGAAGYDDHGESELSFKSGVLLGGLGGQWPGAGAFESKADGATAWRIPVAEWPSFCEWFRQNFRGLETSMARAEGTGNQVVEFQNRPLIGLQAHLLKNEVDAIALTFAAKDQTRVFEITGVKSIQLDLDAAGWPQELELGCDAERVLLRFTGSIQTRPVYSGNSWGE